jgi:hypothetical protein
MPEATQGQAAMRPGTGQNAPQEPWYAKFFRIAQVVTLSIGLHHKAWLTQAH